MCDFSNWTSPFLYKTFGPAPCERYYQLKRQMFHPSSLFLSPVYFNGIVYNEKDLHSQSNKNTR